MRKAFISQMAFSHLWLPLERARELKVISDLLDRSPRIVELVQQELVTAQKAVGAEGMAAEQVLRALIVKQLNGFSFRELAFHLADSQTFSTFCRLDSGELPSKSALAANIKRIHFETLEQINRLVLGMAIEQGIEDGSTVRADCTVTATPIHPPTDSSLLVDAVRVLNHRVRQAQKLLGDRIELVDELRRAKRCGRDIAVAGKEERTKVYIELFALTRKSLEMAKIAQPQIEACATKLRKARRIARELTCFMPRIEKALEQAERRILHEEKVPSGEKILSLFESHTDVIIKNWNDVQFGHKVCLVTGKSSMVLASWVLEGNPCDSTLAKPAIEKSRDNLGGRIPQQAVFDGGFKSRKNLEDLKELQIQDVVFSKHQGIALEEMTTDLAKFEALRCFRAGIEGCISFLKRTFGWDRCSWRTFPSFQAYIAASSLACNLLLLARAQPL
jgi:IS5 family transposase